MGALLTQAFSLGFVSSPLWGWLVGVGLALPGIAYGVMYSVNT
jgi:hypothetical protein